MPNLNILPRWDRSVTWYHLRNLKVGPCDIVFCVAQCPTQHILPITVINHFLQLLHLLHHSSQDQGRHMWGREGKLPKFGVFFQQNVIKLVFFLHMLSTGKLNGLICLIPFRCATWLRNSLTTWHVLAFIFFVQDNNKRAVFEKFYANKFGCQIFQRKSSCSAIGTEQDDGDEDGDQDDEQVKKIQL